MTALIDVLLPLYNTADTLDETLRSLAAQTEGDFRALLIDDGSTDETSAVIAGWAARDPRFVAVTKPNSGIVDTLNLGLSMVTAPLVARLDGDDVCLPERFAAQRAYLDTHAECVAVGCRIEHIDGAGRPLLGFPQPGSPESADMDRVPAREPYIVHPFLMARADALAASGGYRRVPHSEDSDLFWRLAGRGRLHNLAQVLGRYRMHLHSISGGSVTNGRIMAIGSQLGAQSARHRRDGKADLIFDGDLIGALKAAGTLAAMIDHVAAMIEPSELPFFRLAVGIKLLELADYRPYEVESEDCAFIAAHLEPVVWSLSAENQRDIFWYLSRTGSRLIRQGRFRDAATLVPRGQRLRTIGKTALGR